MVELCPDSTDVGSSNLSSRTKFIPGWCNGSHAVLRGRCQKRVSSNLIPGTKIYGFLWRCTGFQPQCSKVRFLLGLPVFASKQTCKGNTPVSSRTGTPINLTWISCMGERPMIVSGVKSYLLQDDMRSTPVSIAHNHTP